MTQDTRTKAALKLAAQMIEVYKWEVIVRRAECYARQANSKQGAWMAFAAWANRQGKLQNNELDRVLAEWERKVVTGNPAHED